MSYTNSTAHYSLPQYVASDVPSILSDVNGAFSAIDTAIYNVASSSSSGAAAITALQTRMSTAEGNISTAQDDIDTAETNINANASAITSLQTRVTTAEGKITTAESAIDALEAQNGSETLVTTAQTLSGAINEIAQGGSATVEAENVTYDNTDSGLTATDVQAAIDELAAGSGSDTLVASVTGDGTKTFATLLAELYSEISSDMTYTNQAKYYIVFNLDNSAMRVLLPAGGDPTINAFDFSWCATGGGTFYNQTMRLYSTGLHYFGTAASMSDQSSTALGSTSSISIYKRN